MPDPFGGGRMHDRIKAIEIMRKAVGLDKSIVGWVKCYLPSYFCSV